MILSNWQLKSAPNCLLDNRWSSIKCPAAVVRARPASTAASKAREAPSALPPLQPSAAETAMAKVAFAAKPDSAKAAAPKAAPAKPISSMFAAPSAPANPKAAEAEAENAKGASSGKSYGKRIIEDSDSDGEAPPEKGTGAAPKDVPNDEPKASADSNASKKRTAPPPSADRAGGVAGFFAKKGTASSALAETGTPAATAEEGSAPAKKVKTADGQVSADGAPAGSSSGNAETEEAVPKASPAAQKAAAAKKAAEEKKKASKAAAAKAASAKAAAEEAKAAKAAEKAAADTMAAADKSAGDKAAYKAALRAEAEKKATAAPADQAVEEADSGVDNDAGEDSATGPPAKKLKLGGAPTTPLSDEAEARTGDGTSAAAGPTPRTHIVKERVKEEKTYMDERGYLVCEEVWVEKEVEREVSSYSTSSASATSKLKPSVSSAPKARSGVGKAKEPRGMDSVDAAELDEAKPKAKGAAKAQGASVKVATGKSSIMGFFGKK